MSYTKAETQSAIRAVCDETRDMLLKKNDSYGNSAITPIKIFASGTSEEQIFVRIDDKLNRIMNGGPWPGDNDLDDLIGYLLLLKTVRRLAE